MDPITIMGASTLALTSCAYLVQDYYESRGLRELTAHLAQQETLTRPDIALYSIGRAGLIPGPFTRRQQKRFDTTLEAKIAELRPELAAHTQ